MEFLHIIQTFYENDGVIKTYFCLEQQSIDPKKKWVFNRKEMKR